VTPLLDELIDWLRIPSISTGGGDPADLERAAAWARERVIAAGGTCELVRVGDGNPLVVGDLPARDPDAPTVFIYGHYDVQGPGDLSLWESPPFEPEVRDGRIWARGAADDKGNFLPLLRAACDMAQAGELPVNVRVLVEGEEEAGGESVPRWLRSDARGAGAAIVFDSGMVDATTPAVTVGLRGLVQMTFEVRTGARDLHSGMWGGTALNALHAVHAMVGAVMPGPDGRVPEPLRAGIEPPSEAERESWARLPPAPELLAAVGGRELYPGAAAEYHERNGADASLDVNELAGGAARTVLPVSARATVSIRLAPRQDPAAIGAELERMIRAAAPEGAEMRVIDSHSAEPALFETSEPAIRLAGEALERACGVPPAFVRSGGSIPIVAAFAAKGIPVIVTGFVLPDDAFHAPNESMHLRGLELGERAAHELLAALAAL
jgi:acetylornithine deacetylase/succinyl-diaminopimelate desuccinylase-like protein